MASVVVTTWPKTRWNAFRAIDARPGGAFTVCALSWVTVPSSRALGELQVDTIAVAPPDQHVERPDARPVHARRAVEERPPEPADRIRMEAGGLDRPRVAQRLVHRFAQPAPDPAVEGQHEPTLWPIEERGV